MAHPEHFRVVRRRSHFSGFSGMALSALALAVPVRAEQIDIEGPSGSVAFGTSVTVLPNGNFVVTDPDAPPSSRGAAYLYSANRTLVSTLTGSSASDHVGSGGVVIVGNGNFVVISPQWNNAGAAAAGAVTWVNGETGLTDSVTPGNSLVGTTSGDKIGANGSNHGIIAVTVLSNGNYVVDSPFWGNGVAGSNIGAVTWGNGNSGVTGAVWEGNSLVGTTTGDQVGANNGQGPGIVALSNGNYVVPSPFWNNGLPGSHVGAASWGNGSSGTTGPVSISNSLVGSTAGDFVGLGVTALSNGNYVVTSRQWSDAAAASVGAATWGNGDSGTKGTISAGNSLVGTTTGDYVGVAGTTALSNGNYVVASYAWNNGAASSAGAATWGNGSSGTIGHVSIGNSLVGSSSGDQVGTKVTALNNGNYVVSSQAWTNGVPIGQFGAATWGNGASGITGIVSANNSLVGTTQYDYVGSDVTALSNGNYVVASAYWNNGVLNNNVGAVTLCNGSSGVKGPVSATNSLVGTAYGDHVGIGGVTALNNGNYVVASGYWNNGMPSYNQVGAVTWANGTSGITGPVSPSNSLIGTTGADRIGFYGVHALSNGNFVIASANWNNGLANYEYGAVTWGNGSTGITGPVSATNSLTGVNAGDRIGGENFGDVTVLSDGYYAVVSPSWNAGRGAVTFASGASRLSGTIQPSNSVLGTTPGGGIKMVVAYDQLRHRLVVGRPADNVVSLFTDQIFTSNFEL